MPFVIIYVAPLAICICQQQACCVVLSICYEVTPFALHLQPYAFAILDNYFEIHLFQLDGGTCINCMHCFLVRLHHLCDYEFQIV